MEVRLLKGGGGYEGEEAADETRAAVLGDEGERLVGMTYSVVHDVPGWALQVAAGDLPEDGGEASSLPHSGACVCGWRQSRV